MVKNPPSSAGMWVRSAVREIKRPQASEQLSRWATARVPALLRRILQDAAKISPLQLRAEESGCLCLAGCVTRHKFLNLSETQFPHP